MPSMAPYPSKRIEESPPFTYTDLDYLCESWNRNKQDMVLPFHLLRIQRYSFRDNQGYDCRSVPLVSQKIHCQEWKTKACYL